jgi:hypothetical protein
MKSRRKLAGSFSVVMLCAFVCAPAKAQVAGLMDQEQMAQFAPMLEMMKQKMGKRRFGQLMRTVGPMMANMMQQQGGAERMTFGQGQGMEGMVENFGSGHGMESMMFGSGQGMESMLGMLGSHQGIRAMRGVSVPGLPGGRSRHSGKKPHRPVG